MPSETMEIFLYKAWPTGTWPGRGHSLHFQAAIQETPYLDLSHLPPLNLSSNKHKSLEKVLRVVSVNIEKISIGRVLPFTVLAMSVWRPFLDSDCKHCLLWKNYSVPRNFLSHQTFCTVPAEHFHVYSFLFEFFSPATTTILRYRQCAGSNTRS